MPKNILSKLSSGTVEFCSAFFLVKLMYEFFLVFLFGLGFVRFVFPFSFGQHVCKLRKIVGLYFDFK